MPVPYNGKMVVWVERGGDCGCGGESK